MHRPKTAPRQHPLASLQAAFDPNSPNHKFRHQSPAITPNPLRNVLKRRQKTYPKGSISKPQFLAVGQSTTPVVKQELSKSEPIFRGDQQILRFQSQARYLQPEQLYEQLVTDDKEYAVKYIVTKQKLLGLMDRYSTEQMMQIEPYAKLLVCQKEKMFLSDRVNSLSYALKKYMHADPREMTELQKRLKQYDPDWKIKLEKTQKDMEMRYQNRLAKAFERIGESEKQINRLLLQIDDHVRKETVFKQLFDGQSFCLDKFALNKKTLFTVIQQYIEQLDIKKLYEEASLKVQQLTAEMIGAQVENKRVLEQRITQTQQKYVKKISSLQQQNTFLSKTVPQLQIQIQSQKNIIAHQDTKMDQFCTLIHYNSKEILRLRIQLSKNDQEREFLKRQFDKLNDRISNQVYKQTKVVEKFNHLYVDLLNIQKKREVDVKKIFKSLETTQHLSKEQQETLYKEKFQYLHYLGTQDTRLRDEIISEMKGELFTLSNENTNLKNSLKLTDFDLLEARAFLKMKNDMMEKYSSMTQDLLNSVKTENRRTRTIIKRCQNCKISANVLSTCQKILQQITREQKEMAKAEAKLNEELHGT